MATIYKRGKTWWGNYSVNGKKKLQSLKTQSERVALQWKKDIEARETVRLLSEPSNTPLLPFLSSFCKQLIADQTHKGAYNDLSRLRCFFGPCVEELYYRPRGRHNPDAPNGTLLVAVKKLEDITPLMISTRLTEDVADGTYSQKTANDYREILQRLFNHAIQLHGYTCPDARYRNPIEAVKRFKESAPVITYLTLEDIPEQLDAVVGNNDMHAAVATMIYAGLRRSEVFWLTDDDVDLKRKLIRVRAKSVDGRSWKPKTGKDRVVPIGRYLNTILNDYVTKRKKKKGPWFAPGPERGFWDSDNFSRDLAALNSKAGLSWSCLDFRHTFGSQLAQRGVTLYKISEMMGNSPEICRRHYAALCPEAMHADVEFNKLEEKDSKPLAAAQPAGDEGPKLRLVM